MERYRAHAHTRELIARARFSCRRPLLLLLLLLLLHLARTASYCARLSELRSCAIFHPSDERERYRNKKRSSEQAQKKRIKKFGTKTRYFFTKQSKHELML